MFYLQLLNLLLLICVCILRWVVCEYCDTGLTVGASLLELFFGTATLASGCHIFR